MRGWIRRVLPLLALLSVAPAQDAPGEPPERNLGDDQLEEILEGLRFGPYRHLYASRERNALSRRVRKLLADLRGVHYRCPRCKGSGEITVKIRDGYWLDEFTWVEPVYVNRTCPRCEGPGKLFNESLALRFFQSAARADDARADRWEEARDSFVGKIKTGERTYLRMPGYKIDLKGRYALVDGKDPIFPLRFMLLPKGKSYEWYMHDARLNGPFDYGRETGSLPAQARIAHVAAGDTLLLANKSVLRLCGVTIPVEGHEIPKPDVLAVNEVTRDLVREELEGKLVTLSPDKYATITCDGHSIAFVELDGKDYAEDLLRRGLARLHPKHKHRRFGTYRSAETEAKKAKVGIWAE